MKFSNMRMVYYIAGCLSSAPPSNMQEDLDRKMEQWNSHIQKSKDLLEVQETLPSIIEDVSKLVEYTQDAITSLHDLIPKDLPYHLDIDTASELLQIPFDQSWGETIAPLGELEGKLFFKRFEKILKETGVMRSGINMVTGNIADLTLTAFTKISYALLRYPELNITDVRALCLDPLEEFIASDDRNHTALCSKVEKNLDVLNRTIHFSNGKIDRSEDCSTLLSLVKTYLDSFSECVMCLEQMRKYVQRLHNFIYLLVLKFEAFKSKSEEWVTEAEILDACFNHEFHHMLSELHNALKHNKKCLWGVRFNLSGVIPKKLMERLHPTRQL